MWVGSPRAVCSEAPLPVTMMQASSALVHQPVPMYWLHSGRSCSNYRIEIGAVGIKNLEDLANRKLLSDCQNTSTLIIPNRKLLYN